MFCDRVILFSQNLLHTLASSRGILFSHKHGFAFCSIRITHSGLGFIIVISLCVVAFLCSRNCLQSLFPHQSCLRLLHLLVSEAHPFPVPPPAPPASSCLCALSVCFFVLQHVFVSSRLQSYKHR